MDAGDRSVVAPHAGDVWETVDGDRVVVDSSTVAAVVAGVVDDGWLDAGFRTWVTSDVVSGVRRMVGRDQLVSLVVPSGV